MPRLAQLTWRSWPSPVVIIFIVFVIQEAYSPASTLSVLRSASSNQLLIQWWGLEHTRNLGHATPELPSPPRSEADTSLPYPGACQRPDASLLPRAILIHYCSAPFYTDALGEVVVIDEALACEQQQCTHWSCNIRPSRLAATLNS